MTDPKPFSGDPQEKTACSNPDRCGCMSRRDALRLLGVGTAGLAALSGSLAAAGPFEASDFEKLVPADKRLNPDWLSTLTQRGEPQVYAGEELRFIGMPVGGICAGQLYLGGDGKLWHWDIFNQHIGTGSEHYAGPLTPSSPLEQGFAIRIRTRQATQTRTLDRRGFGRVTFRGEYPIGIVEYSGESSPVSVRLEAFSPFIPLSADDSCRPATVMQFTVKNAASEPLQCDLAGWLENAVGLGNEQGTRATRVLAPDGTGVTLLEHSAAVLPPAAAPAPRPEIVFDDFEKPAYEGWKGEGKAFGTGPAERKNIPAYQGDVAGQGDRVVNSHATAPGDGVEAKDAQTGKLISREFTIERNFINFWIGGGSHKDRTCLNVVIDGKTVASVTGANNNRMAQRSIDVRAWAGKSARIEIVDQAAEAWGNVGVDAIVFADKPAEPEVPLAERPDFGTLALAVLGNPGDVKALAQIAGGPLPEAAFAAPADGQGDAQPIGSIVCGLELAPGEEKTVTFVVAWHFANLNLPPLPRGRYYATRWTSAADVVGALAERFDTLAATTRLWRDTWYDSTLPYWFLDRTLANASTLATSTSHWLANGRFYGWEGVGCCPGTCAHVWHYAHSVARLFPQLERSARVMADYGAGFNAETGQIAFRAEHAGHWAVDGQAGCILRAYREHQMSADETFLQSIWPRVKRSVEFLISRDANDDGVIEGPQHNTLDSDWYGKVAWLSGLYLAALRAGEEMAREMGDGPFAARCRILFEKGRRAIDETLFNGEYYIQKPDPAHAGTVGSYDGCEIDQVFAQSWAWQVGLGRILDPQHVQTALRSLWRYNFTPDVGPYRKANTPGRWYAMPGEGGLLMCTWPRGTAMRVSQGFDFYFNECMNGFEYQVAWHMIAEGMVEEGLVIARTVHDRYHAARRNPWNEVECGDHYARSMASHGVFLAACGYEYHGPHGHLGFAPRIAPENFRAAFTAAEGWGTFAQKAQTAGQTESIAVKWGRVKLRTLAFGLCMPGVPAQVSVTHAGNPVPASLHVADGRAEIALDSPVTVEAGQSLEVTLSV